MIYIASLIIILYNISIFNIILRVWGGGLRGLDRINVNFLNGYNEWIL